MERVQVTTEMDHADSQGQGVGARVLRKEDERHLHGRGNFIADMSMPGLQEIAFVRSSMAHAGIAAIQVENAAEVLGRSVFLREHLSGASDIVADSSLPTYQRSAQPPLASGKVRFVGEPVVMVCAPTRADAEDLAETVQVEYADLPVFANVEAAKAGAAQGQYVHDGWTSNHFLTLQADIGFDACAAQGSRVVHRKLDLARQCMVPMEGKAVLAYWDERADQLVVYTASQVPHMIRTILAECLGLAQDQVRVVAPDVGGAFGYKCVLQQEELCIAWLAMKFRKPFRFIEDRREHLIAGANSREHHYDLTAHVDPKGRLLALDAKIVIDGGAYSVWPFTIGLEPGQALGNLPGPYAFRGYRCVTEAIATNKPGFVPYRGVARTGVCFAIELLMDAIAREVGREPWQVRAENLVPPEAMPYVNVTNKHFDGGDYPASLLKAKDMVGFDAVRERQRKARAAADAKGNGKLIGVGFATYVEQSAHGTSVFAAWGTPVIPGFDSATVRLTPDGGAEIRVGVHSHGQGMETTLAQIAHEVLGVDIYRTKVVHGDTAFTPFSTGTYASRSIVYAGGAVSRACKILLPRVLAIGAHLLKTDADDVHLQAGRIVSTSTGQGVSLADVTNAWYLRPQLLPADVDRAGLETTAGYKPNVDTGSFTYASHAVVVEVDTLTGKVRILDYAIVEDCGVMVNPLVVEGQTFGGVAQGVGTAMYEEMRYDANGQPLASTLADYMLPGATEVPHMQIHHFVTPSPNTEFGVKGMGEGGAIAPPAAIFNAVNDAIQHLGAEMTSTPLTPHKLLHALQQGQHSAASETPQAAARVAAAELKGIAA